MTSPTPESNSLRHLNDMEMRERREKKNTITLENGIVIRVNRVPRLLIEELQMRVPVPKVPKMFIPEKDREEENPNDPNYQEELFRSQQEKASIQVNGVIALGVEIVSVPEGMDNVDDDGWADDCAFLGMEVSPKGSRARKVEYMKYYALPDPMEGVKIMQAALRGTFTLEGDVATATESFPSDASRNTDNGTVPVTEGQ